MTIVYSVLCTSPAKKHSRISLTPAAYLACADSEVPDVCGVVTINCPLHPETENLFDDEMIGKMKKGAYIVNTARGKI